jgi:hypothetical protein
VQFLGGAQKSIQARALYADKALVDGPQYASVPSHVILDRQVCCRWWACCMLSRLCRSFFFVELVWGIRAASLALVADAMHMLSDLIGESRSVHSP